MHVSGDFSLVLGYNLRGRCEVPVGTGWAMQKGKMPTSWDLGRHVNITVVNVTDLYGDSAANSGLVCRWSVSLFYLVSSKWLGSEVIFLIHTNDMSLFILCIYFC